MEVGEVGVYMRLRSTHQDPVGRTRLCIGTSIGTSCSVWVPALAL